MDKENGMPTPGTGLSSFGSHRRHRPDTPAAVDGRGSADLAAAAGAPAEQRLQVQGGPTQAQSGSAKKQEEKWGQRRAPWLDPTPRPAPPARGLAREAAGRPAPPRPSPLDAAPVATGVSHNLPQHLSLSPPRRPHCAPAVAPRRTAQRRAALTPRH